MMELEKKKKKYQSDATEGMATVRDLFGELPTELLSFLITLKKLGIHSPFRFEDTKEAVKTIILSKRFLHAWSTFPDLYLSHLAFCKLPRFMPTNANQIQELLMEREKFANYVLHTLTRYQQHNIPIRRLLLTARLQDNLPSRFTRVEGDDDRVANILEQSILKAKENGGVKEVYIHMLEKVRLNDVVLRKLILSCPLIERIKLYSCEGLETIQIDNLPYLKRLKVYTIKNQMVYVRAASLEFMKYGQIFSPNVLNIESARRLKILKFDFTYITDAYFHNLIAKCPVLEELTLCNCDAIQKINISSHSLSFSSISSCQELMEVKIDAPILNTFEYEGGNDTGLPSLSFANGGSVKRKSSVSLYLDNLAEASSFLELSKFLMAFKHSDTISLTISTAEEISFDKNMMDGLRDQNSIPEFEEVYIATNEEFITVSSQCSTLMEGLLWSFSPKIISVIHSNKVDDKFIMHLSEELLAEHDDRHPNVSTSPSNCWRNYFKHAKFKARDDEWRPLHSWKSVADVLKNLEVKYILSLSHD